MKWGLISSHKPDDNGGEGRDEWEDWERSEGRDSGESMPTPVSEKNWEGRGASGEGHSHLDGGGGKGVPDSLPAPTLKGSSNDASPVRADLGGHLKYSRRWSGVRAGVLLGALGAVRRGESRGGL